MRSALLAGVVAALLAASAHAQLAVSANDNKLVLIDGVPSVVQKPAPDTVALIDLGAKPPSLIRHLQVPTSVVGPPLSVALTPDESLLLVTSSARLDPQAPGRLVPDKRLSVVALKANPLAVTELEAGLGAAGVSISRDGRLALVANRNEGTVSVFRIQSGAVSKVGSVVVAAPESGVAHVAIAPDGRSALVTREGDHTISLLAIDGDKVTYTGRDFGAGLKPYGLVIAADGRHAVVANLGLGRGDNDTIGLIDLTLQPPRVVETYTVGQTPEGIALSPDGKLVAVVTMNGSNKPKDSPFHAPVGRVVLLRLHRDRLQLVSAAPVGAWAQGVAFSADGRTLAVQSMAERNVAVFAVGEDFALRDTGQRIPLQGGGAALRTAERPLR
ncbi:MAG TPA: YncE family protein [Burkholderiales bacterium]|nr:YncE family protein [Burkholderiales bacterium]